jgi:cation:H+ antiporter
LTRLLYRVEAREPAGVVKASAGNYSLGKTLLRFAMNAGLVVLAAFFLPYFGRHLAEYSGWGTTFFGTLFLAASTSMPELVVSVASLRRGSLDLAVGNLFGSNIFNIVILAVDDFFYRDGPLFARINPEHMVSILVVVMMTAVASAGLLFKSGRKRFVLAADTFIILLLYIGLMIDLYLTR